MKLLATILSILLAAFLFSHSARAQFVLGVTEKPKDTSLKYDVEGARKFATFFVNDLNKMGRTHVPTTLNGLNCGSESAYYDPRTNRIVYCYELAFAVARFLRQFAVATGADGANLAFGIDLFIYRHEGAHALIQQHQIPIAGREEDVADQIAVYLALKMYQDLPGSQYQILGPLSFFEYYVSLPSPGAFADEHSLSQQRIANIACWAYGGNPVKFSDLPRKYNLPQSRIAKCSREFMQIHNFMQNVFGPAVFGRRGF